MDWTDAITLALTVGVLARVVQRHRRARSAVVRARRAPAYRDGEAFFVAAVVVQCEVLVWPVRLWANDQLYARTLCDLGEVFLVAPLVVWWAQRRGYWPVSTQRLRGAGTPMWIRRAGRWSGHPLVNCGEFLAVELIWHLPPVLDASVGSVPLQLMEYASMLGAGVALWRPLLGRASRAGWGPLRRTWMIAAVLAGTSVIGAALLFSMHAWYPGFAGVRHGPLSAHDDQSLAGAFLVGVPVLPLGGLAIWCYAAWLCDEEEQDDQLGAQVDSVLGDREPQASRLLAPGVTQRAMGSAEERIPWYT